MHQQAIRFAKYMGTHVIRWKLNDKKWRPSLNKHNQNIATNDPCFWQYFIAGADGYLATNINTEINLANGTPIRHHSITLPNAQEENEFQKKIQRSPTGSIITLNTPPLSVNVIPFPKHDNDKEQSDDMQTDLQDHSIATTENGNIVIPIIHSHADKKDYKTCLVRGGAKYSFRPCLVDIVDYFPIELSFAMTIHKAQGRTIQRVILALEERPNHLIQMTFSSIYVALTRVKHSDHIRILHHTNPPDYRRLGYITKLHPEKEIFQFFAGFTKDKSTWNAKLALAFEPPIY